METKNYDLEGTREKMLSECLVGPTPLATMLEDGARYRHGHKLACSVHKLDDMLLASIYLMNGNGDIIIRHEHRTDGMTVKSMGYQYFESKAIEVAKTFMATLIQQGVYGAQEMQKSIKNHFAAQQ